MEEIGLAFSADVELIAMVSILDLVTAASYIALGGDVRQPSQQAG